MGSSCGGLLGSHRVSEGATSTVPQAGCYRECKRNARKQFVTNRGVLTSSYHPANVSDGSNISKG